MQKILLPSDFSTTSENALRFALRYSADQHSTIQLLHVVGLGYEPLEVPIGHAQMTQVRVDNGRKHLREFLNRGQAQIQANQEVAIMPDVISNIEVGFPIKTITDLVKRDDIDLVIMGTQGEHSRMDRFFGTVSAGVVEQSHCPVLVVPDNVEYKGIQRACIAINLQKSDPWHIHQAAKLLGPQLNHLDCVHINTSDKYEATEIAMEELRKYYQNNTQEFEMEFHLINGSDLSTELNEFISEKNADALVMTGPHQSNFKRLFFRSNTKQMTYQTMVPLLVLK